MTFDLADGDIVIVGGGRRDGVEVQRTERYSFGRRPGTSSSVEGRRRSASARAARRRCSARARVAYRVVVPDNVALEIRTTYGDVTLRGYRGIGAGHHRRGPIDISGYCGNSLDARAGSGDDRRPGRLRAAAHVAAHRAPGRSTPSMPAGRYDLDAESDVRDATVRGVIARADAPYSSRC